MSGIASREGHNKLMSGTTLIVKSFRSEFIYCTIFNIDKSADLRLHCLSTPHKKDARLIWVNTTQPYCTLYSLPDTCGLQKRC